MSGSSRIERGFVANGDSINSVSLLAVALERPLEGTTTLGFALLDNVDFSTKASAISSLALNKTAGFSSFLGFLFGFSGVVLAAFFASTTDFLIGASTSFWEAATFLGAVFAIAGFSSFIFVAGASDAEVTTFLGAVFLGTSFVLASFVVAFTGVAAAFLEAVVLGSLVVDDFVSALASTVVFATFLTGVFALFQY